MTQRTKSFFLGIFLLSATSLAFSQATFEEHVVATNFNRTSGLYVCDLDGDGNKDIVGAAINANEVAWWRNEGGDTIVWTKQTIASGYGGAIYVFTADIDHDGDMDVLATAANAGEVAWFRNDGGNPIVWNKVLIAQNFSDAHGIQAHDIDSDGDMDIIATSAGLNKICWWENTSPDGDGSSWEEHTVATNFSYTQTVSPADIDGDGHIDLVAGAGQGNQVAWWRNSGGNPIVWTKQIIDNTFLWPHCVVARDIDGDGRTDVVGAGWISSQIVVWRNLGGNPIVWQKQVVSPFGGTCEVTIADMNNDGKLDIIGSAWTAGECALWRNGGGSPVKWTKNTIGNLVNAWPVDVGDLDNDGYADVVSGSETLNKIVCWLNRSHGPKAPTSFSGYCESGTTTSIVLRWNDPTEYQRGGLLSNFKLHLYRDSTLVAEVGSGVQAFTDTNIAIPGIYNYHINVVTEDDSSESDSITIYANKLLSEYSEDFEHGAGTIYRTGTWDTARSLDAGGTAHFITDSPGGNYPLNSESYFLLPRIVLAGQPVLTFDQIAIIEDPSFGWIDISTDEGNSYQPLASYCSSLDTRWQDRRADSGDWAAAAIDLTPYSGDTVILRFRLTTANNLECDGWYIDNIKISRADSMTSFTHSLASAWNLLSLPLAPVDGSVREIFPDAISHAFVYRNTYTVEDALCPGLGYWLKYGASTTVQMTGRSIPHDTIRLNERWNLIGVAGAAINAAAIIPLPAGILQTGFYTYNGSSYTLVQTLQPGKGYWVKASQAGMIILSTMPKNVNNPVELKKSYIRDTQIK
jgi:hypothetical protein